MTLPEKDAEYMDEHGLAYETVVEANMTCVVVPHYRLPEGYDTSEVELLLRLSPGYPDIPPDMWWLNPGVKLVDGRIISATEVKEAHLGREWQRWSRHLSAGQWQPGKDSLESYLALIGQELERRAMEPTA